MTTGSNVFVRGIEAALLLVSPLLTGVEQNFRFLVADMWRGV